MKDTSIIKEILEVGNCLTNYRNKQMKKYDVTSMQSDAIRYILYPDKEEITATDLINHLGRSQSNIAGVLERLEQKGLIIRIPSEVDARKSIIKPTEKGMCLRNSLNESAEKTVDIIFKNMTLEEQKTFHRLLNTAIENMKSTEID